MILLKLFFLCVSVPQGPGTPADTFMGREIPNYLLKVVLGEQSKCRDLWPWLHEADTGEIRWEQTALWLR